MDDVKFPPELVEQAMALRRTLMTIEDGKWWDRSPIIGMGTAEAHAKHRTLEEWIVIWAKANAR